MVAFAATALVGFLRAWRTDVELRRHEHVRAALRRSQARVVVPPAADVVRRATVARAVRESVAFDVDVHAPFDWAAEEVRG